MQIILRCIIRPTLGAGPTPLDSCQLPSFRTSDVMHRALEPTSWSSSRENAGHDEICPLVESHQSYHVGLIPLSIVSSSISCRVWNHLPRQVLRLELFPDTGHSWSCRASASCRRMPSVLPGSVWMYIFGGWTIWLMSHLFWSPCSCS